jgi:hypothetical protein
MAGVEPRYEEWDGVGSLLDFVYDKNWNRRQLTPSQRAVIAAEAKPLYAKEAKERQVLLAGTRPNTQPGDLDAQTREGATGRTDRIVAKKFGVGSNYVSRAERVKTNEQVGREMLVKACIVRERADRRKKAGVNLMQISTYGDEEKGTTRDIVGAQFGVSGFTAERQMVREKVWDSYHQEEVGVRF